MRSIWLAVLGGLAAGLLQAEDSPLAQAVFTRELRADGSPGDITTLFAPTEAVHLSLEFKKRPAGGIVSARFFFREEVINEASVDLGRQVLEEGDEGLYVSFTLKPKEPFPVGELYRVETRLDEQPLGVHRFEVAAPRDAIGSRVVRSVLSTGPVEDLTRARDVATLAPADTAVLSGTGDFGRQSWLQAEWRVAGEVDEDASRILSFEENKPGTPFEFQFRPEGGWPEGDHEVGLFLNGREVARKKFAVKAAVSPEAPVLRSALHRDDGEGRPGPEVEGFSVEDRILHFVCELREGMAPAEGEITWRIVEAEGGLSDVEMGRAPLRVREAERLAGRFTAARELPRGKYRVTITSGGKVLAEQEFSIR